MSMLAELVDVVIGVDTHTDTHTAAVVLAGTGAAVAELTVPTDAAGLRSLLTWAQLQPGRRCWAIEGTGSFGLGLTELLEAHDEDVIEVERPHRAARRHGAKSDRIDAVRAAREALTLEHRIVPKHGPERAALAALLTVRRSAVDAVREAHQQLHALILTAPQALRDRFTGTTHKKVTLAAALRIPARADVRTRSTITALRTLARRALTLSKEAKTHEKAIFEIVKGWRPDLLDQYGVGAIVAATVLCAWSHPGRFRSDAAFATLAGVAPIPADSGKRTNKNRLSRYGNRDLNSVLHTIAITRIQRDKTTRAYVERRRAEGKTDREIRRCLKRYIARQLYKLLETTP
jgi:transposase